MRERTLTLLSEHAAPEAVSWLQKTLSTLESKFEKRPFYYAFSGVSRHFDKSGRIPGDADETFGGWDHFRLARVTLLLSLAQEEESVFIET
ncbi:MAG: hypothetical protein AAF491_09355, partial [Verrucomicrobiota bacterium]